MALALLLPGLPAFGECKATSNVPEFKDRIKAACRPGIVSIDVSGDHEKLTEELVLDRDYSGAELDEAIYFSGAGTARDSAIILDAIYPMKVFVLEIRDRKRRPLCRYEVTDERTIGRCRSMVE